MTARRHSLVVAQSLGNGLGSGTTYSLAAEHANAKHLEADGSLSELKTIAYADGGLQRPGLSMGYRLAEAHPAALIVESTHAVNGTGLTALSKGGTTGKYQEAVAHFQAGKASAIGAGDTFETIAIHLQQGERDQGTDNTPLNAYVQLMADWLTDYRTDTAQPDVFFVSCQTATWKWYEKPFRIGGAQLKAARTLEDFYIVGGQYQLQSSSDGLHMTSRGYYSLGELHARVEESVVTGVGWKPFAPAHYEVAGTSLTVTFDVPVGPLVFDTTTVPAMPDMGFSLASTDAEITGVSITSTDTVTLTLDRPLDAATFPQLGYGVAYSHATFNPGCGLGNLRDSDPRKSARGTVDLFNWSCQFQDRIFGVEPPEPTIPSTYRLIGTPYLVGDDGLRYPVSF